MPILGTHQSIAGGYHRAVERAAARGYDCVQLFTANPRSFGTHREKSRFGKVLTKNNTPRRASPIAREQVEQFRQALRECGVGHPLAHDSYLVNLASPEDELWRKSVRAFVEELERAEMLGIPFVVTHPGSYTDSTPRAGIRRIVRALNQVHKATRDIAAQCLLETTAGQGTALGWQFEHLAQILDGVNEPERLGVCFDTCHVFAAGHPLAGRDQYEETMARLDAAVGLGRIKALHLNDSAREFGSRVDRHAHIGRGKMGLEPFRLLLADERFCSVPMVLETPKGQEAGVDFDVINLRTLQGLAPQAGDPTARPKGAR